MGTLRRMVDTFRKPFVKKTVNLREINSDLKGAQTINNAGGGQSLSKPMSPSSCSAYKKAYKCNKAYLTSSIK